MGWPIKFDNQVSVMDIFVICVAILGGGSSYWALQGGVATNAREITHIQENVNRIEAQGRRDNQAILELLKEQKNDLQGLRQETAEGRRRTEDKLDRLIERKLSIK